MSWIEKLGPKVESEGFFSAFRFGNLYKKIVRVLVEKWHPEWRVDLTFFGVLLLGA